MSKLLINGKEKQVTMSMLQREFGPGSPFEEKYGYPVDFDSPLVFRLTSTFFKPDPLNEGKSLAPRNYTIPTKSLRDTSGQTDELVYFERQATHTYGKGANARQILITEPPSLVIKDGRYTVDLSDSNRGVKNYAAAYFMLSHPKLGSTFYYYNPNAEAKVRLARRKEAIKVVSMLTDEQHPQYVSDEAVRSLAKKAQIPSSDRIDVTTLRDMLVSFSESREPNKGSAVILQLLKGTKEYEFVATIQEAIDYGIIFWSPDHKSFFYTEKEKQQVGIRLVDSSSPIVVLKDHEVSRHMEAFAGWLINIDTRGNNMQIVHLLNKEKEFIASRNAASGKKDKAVKPDSFSVQFL